MNLDEMVLRVCPGNGVIARFGGAVLAIMEPDASQDPMVDEILRVVEECVGRTALPGRSVSRQLAAMISQAEPEQVPSFAALAQVEGGLAILMHGSIEATVSGPGGGELLSGRQAASWVDRIIETAIDSVVVGSPGDGTVVPDERTQLLGGVVPGGGLSLVVAGATVDAGPGEAVVVADEGAKPTAGAPQPVASEPLPSLIGVPEPGAGDGDHADIDDVDIDDADIDDADLDDADAGDADVGDADVADVDESDQAESDLVQEPALDEPEAPAEPELPGESTTLAEREVPDDLQGLSEADVAFLSSDEPQESPEPVMPGRATVSPQALTAVVPEPGPAGQDEPAPIPDAPDDRNEASGPVIKGVICARGHFGNPSSAYCSKCGTSMDHRTLNLVDGNRPPLGALVFDDGATCALDGDYVLGREPERDETVVSGTGRPLLVTDEDLEISRIHAGVVLDGWDVTIVDLDSANGTFMSNPDGSWTRLIPHVPVVMSPGMRVRLGQRTMLFDSPGSH
ncbi:MAG: FHA domain-containing protein [Acidimicrobiales bacterium]